jgi:hypothetical protein
MGGRHGQRRDTEALVAALEACAADLEQMAGSEAAVPSGSLPRLRPPSLGVGLGRMAPAAPGMEGAHDAPGLAQDALELAAEFRDVAREVARGEAGRGWLNSLLGRASRHLGDAALAPVRAAALGVV